MRKGSERLLLGTLLVSTIGDEITQVALIFRIAPNGSSLEVAGLLIALLLPGALAAPYAGKLVDERDAGKVLGLAALVQALVSVALAMTASPVAALAGAAALSILFTFSGAATFALIPIVGREAGLPVARVNAAMEFAGGGGAVFGPLVGGALVAVGGVTTALLIDAATFGLLGAVVWWSRLSRTPEPPDGPSGWSLLAVARSYAGVVRIRPVMLLLASFWVVILTLAISDAVYVFLVMKLLGGGAFLYGALIAAWALAYLVGAWAFTRSAERHPHRAAFAGGAGMAASFLMISLAGLFLPDLPTAIVALAFLVGGFGNAIYNISVRTILHTDVPPALHGRAAALYGTGIRVSETAGYFAGGLLGPARVILAYSISGIAALGAALTGSTATRGARAIATEDMT
ncbi:MFS transporter [Novosphingobium sp. TCA1]|uniref:MFS transporter n=1 Tax=Novosphingobium sp. TCA1 TaxID=2682474 RepID=UPI001307058D|nr:MFS transporter [Novosphingobium sp. TCA1]GFE77272.1 hypothetical protein NTCA1_49210 [Novosphingobium sp. TCA1]